MLSYTNQARINTTVMLNVSAKNAVQMISRLRDSLVVRVSSNIDPCRRNSRGVVVNTLKNEYLNDCETEVTVTTTRSI